jgi:predicted RNA polymerase sigma factor
LYLQPHFPSAYIVRADICHNLGDIESAIGDFQKAADLYQQEGNTQYSQQIIDIIRNLQQ